MVAGLIDPQAVRLEIGRGREMRRVDLAFAAERGNDLCRQEVRVDDHVPGVVSQQTQQPPQVQAFDQQPQAVGLALCRRRPVEHVIGEAQQVRGRVDQVDIQLAIQTAEGGVGQIQDVDVLDLRLRGKLPQGQFDRLGRPHVPRPTDSGKDQDPFWHGDTSLPGNLGNQSSSA